MTDTINNVPRELLADLLGNDHDKRIMAERHVLAMLANAPSPAGVDGLEVALSSEQILEVFERNGFRIELGASFSARGQIARLLNAAGEIGRLSDATAIIDGLRGEVGAQRVKTCTALKERNDAREERDSFQRAGIRAVEERDQQAQRAGELREEISDLHRKLDKFYSKSHGIPALAEIERLSEERDHLAALLRLTKTIDWAGLDLDEWSDRVDAALSAGHEPKQCT